MDRAPPLRDRREFFRDSFRDRGDFHNHNLNRPVPPPRVLRGDGFGARTYADVARGPDLDKDGHEVRRLPADSDLKLLIRKLYAVIKAVHHLHNITPGTVGTGPRTITKMMNTLSTMVKPAAPTPTTRLLIEGAARQWGHTVCIILKQHDEDCLDGLLGELTGLPAGTWREAFRVATRWARRNLPRITGDTIAAAEALLTSRTEEERDPTPIRAPDVPPPRSSPLPAAVPSPGRASPPAIPPRTRPPRPRPPPTSVSLPNGVGEEPSSDGCITPPTVDPPQVTEGPPLEQRGPRKARGVVPHDSSEDVGGGPPLLERLSEGGKVETSRGPSTSQASMEKEKENRTVARLHAKMEELDVFYDWLSGGVNRHPPVKRRGCNWY